MFAQKTRSSHKIRLYEKTTASINYKYSSLNSLVIGLCRYSFYFEDFTVVLLFICSQRCAKTTKITAYNFLVVSI